MKFLITACIFLSVLVLTAQELNSRKHEVRNILIDDGSVYELNVAQGPIIIRDTILQVYPGDKFYLEVDPIKNKLFSYKVVGEIKDKSKTITIEFKQITEGKKHKQMMLAISNPFERPLHYVSSIYLLEHNKWAKTKVMPVDAGKTAYEMWPDIITSISIGSFHF